MSGVLKPSFRQKLHVTTCVWLPCIPLRTSFAPLGVKLLAIVTCSVHATAVEHRNQLSVLLALVLTLAVAFGVAYG